MEEERVEVMGFSTPPPYHLDEIWAVQPVLPEQEVGGAGEGGTKLATLLFSGPLSLQLISGAALLQPITAPNRDKYSSINLILFTFQNHLEGIN